MTQAAWSRVGVSRTAGVYNLEIKKTGVVVVYVPGAYRPGCTARTMDFATTITATGAARQALGPVPVCGFTGAYRWALSARTLVLSAIADQRCRVREAFFGGRWVR
jgi:hypothetical protein